MAESVAPAAAEPAESDWYYSLEAKHVAPNLIDERRFFQWTGPEGACPEDNGKQVNAVPVPAFGVYPSSILEVAARLDQK